MKQSDGEFLLHILLPKIFFLYISDRQNKIMSFIWKCSATFATRYYSLKVWTHTFLIHRLRCSSNGVFVWSKQLTTSVKTESSYRYAHTHTNAYTTVECKWAELIVLAHSRSLAPVCCGPMFLIDGYCVDLLFAQFSTVNNENLFHVVCIFFPHLFIKRNTHRTHTLKWLIINCMEIGKACIAVIEKRKGNQHK